MSDSNSTRLAVERSVAQERIERAIAESEKLLEAATNIENSMSPTVEDLDKWQKERERWDARNRESLRHSFEGPAWADEFNKAATGAIFRVMNQTEWETFTYAREAVGRAANTLQSFLERLEYVGDAADSTIQTATPVDSSGGSRVFIVHGHDHELRDAVSKLVRDLGLNPTVLDEQVGAAKTIIEKFEENATDAGFAIVLMTADDVGYSKGDKAPDAANRARQNVVLELGYFIGKLGRDRVVALKAADVEIPSDIHGVSYIPANPGWELRVAKELKAAGLPVNL